MTTRLELTRAIGRGVIRHNRFEGVAATKESSSCDIHRVQHAG